MSFIYECEVFYIVYQSLVSTHQLIKNTIVGVTGTCVIIRDDTESVIETMRRIIQYNPSGSLFYDMVQYLFKYEDCVARNQTTAQIVRRACKNFVETTPELTTEEIDYYGRASIGFKRLASSSSWEEAML
jgi:hypothetical protein